MLKRIALAALIIAMVVAGGMVGWRSYQDTQVKRAVMAYNNALIRTLSDVSLAPMHKVATPTQVNRVGTYLLVFDGTGTRMEARLRDFAIKATERGDDGRLTVVTSESWTYQDFDVSTEEPVSERRGETSTVEYILIAGDNDARWVVDRVRVLEKTEDERPESAEK